MATERQLLEEARAFVRAETQFVPRVALLLGSGLSTLADALEPVATLPGESIPHLPRCTVPAHEGVVTLGMLGGVRCLALRGRFHLYEGHPARAIVRPVRLARLLGAEILIVTNAAGGIHPDLAPGELMAITDHLNLTGENPLVGEDDDGGFGPRFPDMTAAYDAELRELVMAEARAAGIPIWQGVYAGLRGPSFETPAEIRMLATLGADAVGMSTVLEVIAAAQLGMRVLGLSCITNRAAGLSPHRLSHAEVLEVTAKFSERNRRLLSCVLERLAREGVS